MTELLPLVDLDPRELDLVEAARAVAGRAYCRYSRYAVGAAIQSESGAIFVGCNVENASYGATMCAERAAIFALIAAGERRIERVCVFAPREPLALPCGLCRQVIAEFCLDAQVVVASPQGFLRRGFAQLLPEAFRLDVPEIEP